MGEGQRENVRENPKHPHSAEPDAGLIPGTVRS